MHVANTFIQSHLWMQSNHTEEMKPVTSLPIELQVIIVKATEALVLVCPWRCLNLHVNYEWPIYDTWWPGAIPKPTLNYTYNKLLLLGDNQATKGTASQISEFNAGFTKRFLLKDGVQKT